MKRMVTVTLSVAIGATALVTACSDLSAPLGRTLAVTPLAAHTGGPDLSDFNNFPGELWACPDVPEPVLGFIYKWSITDNTTNTVVQSGISTNVTAGICIKLATVPTGTSGQYTAYVREDPSARLKISSITASYGTNLPIPAPVATLDANGKGISDLITNDYGVVFTFYH